MKISVLNFSVLLSAASHTYSIAAAAAADRSSINTDTNEHPSGPLRRNLAPIAEGEDGVSEAESVETCFDYTEALDIEEKKCSWWYIYQNIRKTYKEQDALEETPRCDGGFWAEIRRLTNTVGTNGKEWKDSMQDLCDHVFHPNSGALDDVDTVDWTRIENADIDLEEFFNGGGFMNNDYGNLQQQASEFERRGGTETYNYIGDDPTQNDYLPTPQRSIDGGKAIGTFYEENLINKFLSAPSFSKMDDGGCPATNAAVCCWSRDRQYNDNNGSCNANGHCRDGNPGDNTDLCWTTDESDTVFPYPSRKTEGSLHCHGYSWSDGDFSDTTKNNNLFFVSMYDHLLKRGYVQSITDDDNIEGNDDIPMCGCVEDMHVVARADCTEIVPRANYTSYQDEETGFLAIEPKMDTFYLEYRACEGYRYNAGITPDSYDENGSKGLRRQNNDLSAYVYRQYLERKKNLQETDAFEETIIGYKDPDVNRGDTQRDTACKRAFEERYPGVEWAEKVQDE